MRSHRPFPAVLGLRLTRSLGIAVAALVTGGITFAQETKSAEAPAAIDLFLDGSLDDWPAGEDAIADGQHVFVRLRLPSAFTLQGGQLLTTLEFDLDGKEETGRDPKKGRLTGADLEVIFSPRSPKNNQIRPGLAVRMIDDRSATTDVGHAAVGLSFAPSFAAEHVELRFDRNQQLPEPAGSRFRASKAVRGRLTIEDEAGDLITEAREFLVHLPKMTAPEYGVLPIPAKDEDTLRVMSWNVEWESPVKNPKPFSRIFKALAPDIILIQEWKSTDNELQAWFSANAPSPTPWRAHTLDGLGVCIVTRHKMVPLTTEPAMPSRKVNNKDKRAIRFVSAKIDTPLGVVIANSVHLKCCGSKGTWEDELRQVETESVNQFLRKALVKTPDAACVISGDLNLVGTDLPLEALRDTLDADGTDLDIVHALVLGDAATYTWTNADSNFSPGRLDYAVFSDSRLAPRRTFILDTARLADGVLKQHRLERADSIASDHRPLVYDLEVRK